MNLHLLAYSLMVISVVSVETTFSLQLLDYQIYQLIVLDTTISDLIIIMIALALNNSNTCTVSDTSHDSHQLFQIYFHDLIKSKGMLSRITEECGRVEILIKLFMLLFNLVRLS